MNADPIEGSPAASPGDSGQIETVEVTRVGSATATRHDDIRFDDRPRTALVVDDDAPSRELFVRFLRRRGFANVDATRDGERAINLVYDTHYDVILLDLRLPGMSGLDVARRIRTLETETGSARTPVVAVTALEMPGMRQGALAAGCDDYAVKPVTFSSFSRLLLRLLVPHDPRGRLPGT